MNSIYGLLNRLKARVRLTLCAAKLSATVVASGHGLVVVNISTKHLQVLQKTRFVLVKARLVQVL